MFVRAQARPQGRLPRRPAELAALAACSWAWIFAAISFYWGLGGTLGLSTLGSEIERLALARDPETLAVGAWGAGIAKILGGVFALAMVQQWGRFVPRRARLFAAWAAGGLLTLYAVANFVQHGLMAAGVVAIPDSFGAEALPWHLLVWDPWWLLGGLLFLTEAWYLTRGSPSAT